MRYSKKKFGSMLKLTLLRDYTPQEIASWAFKVLMKHERDFEEGLNFYVLSLVAMEEGPEFVIPKDELLAIANELIGKSRCNTLKIFDIGKKTPMDTKQSGNLLTFNGIKMLQF